MAISVADLKFFQSQRMTDNEDGGGRMTANEIVSGNNNQIFDDISDVDRAAGDLSLRKIYAAVTSADTDKYLDAGVVILNPPADPATSVVAFTTGDFYDERADLVGELEATISRGVRYNGWLYGQHIPGQRALLLWTRPAVEAVSVGMRLNLVAKAGSVEQYDEYVWITVVTSERRTIIDTNGQFEVQVLTCELAYPLTQSFAGLEPVRYDPTVVSVNALVYETRYNPDIVALHGVKPLAALAEAGDFSVTVAGGLYQQMIPTGLQETALPDTTPGGDSIALIRGMASSEGRRTLSTTLALVKPDGTLFLGRACYPGTLAIGVSGAVLTDLDGVLRLSDGTVVGAIDYSTGVCAFTSACPNYGTATKTIDFQPATRDLRIADTAAIAVSEVNRGYVWVLTLAPIPAPKTLRVSYQVNNVWYTLYERGTGLLSGTDSSYGAGQLNFATGTVTLTTGELPDVDSLILYAWTTPVNYVSRGASTVEAAKLRGTLAHPQIVPGTVEIAWSTLAVAEPDPPDGTLTGTGGEGTIDYATGEWTLVPDDLPALGTEFAISYDYTDSDDIVTETFDSPARELDNSIILDLANTDLEERSLRISYPLAVNAAGLDSWGTPAQLAYSNFTATLRDDGAGGLTDPAGTFDGGEVDYVTGTLTLTPDKEVAYPVPVYTTYTQYTGLQSGPRVIATGWDTETAAAVFPADGTITVTYRLNGTTPSTSETYIMALLDLDLTRGFAERIASGSVEFTLGASRYVDTAGQIYRDPSPETGAGTLAGSLDPTTGIVRLSNWTAGANAVTLHSLTTVLGGQPIDSALFRTPVADLRPGTLQLRATTTAGAVLSETVPESGLLETTEMTVAVDYPDGVIQVQFGRWRTVASLTPEELLEPWYDAGNIIEIGGVDNIWKPLPVLADSIVYNGVAQTTLPPDRDMIGIDASRLPPDGKGLIFQRGKLVLVHHTDAFTEANLSPTQVLDCGRLNLYRVAIDDADGQRLPASFYSVDRELGTVTMATDLDLTGYTGPYEIRHTIADLARITALDISGKLTINKALSHDFPDDETEPSYASAVLYVGTLQARVARLFAQATWTSVWSDERIGDAPLAQYNDVQYPLQVSNAGVYPDRYLIRFTNSTEFNVIGENLGFIGTGNVNEDCAPLNALTGVAYFTLDYRGWGGGWATGNCLRFNLVGACYPVALIRSIQPSAPTALDDSVELCFIGNVDA